MILTFFHPYLQSFQEGILAFPESERGLRNYATGEKSIDTEGSDCGLLQGHKRTKEHNNLFLRLPDAILFHAVDDVPSKANTLKDTARLVRLEYSTVYIVLD